MKFLTALALIFILTVNAASTSPVPPKEWSEMVSNSSPLTLQTQSEGSIASIAKSLFEKILGISKLSQMYLEIKNQIHSPEDFCRLTLNTLHIENNPRGDWESIPKEGSALVVVAKPPQVGNKNWAPLAQRLEASSRASMIGELYNHGLLTELSKKDDMIIYLIKGKDLPADLMHHIGVLRENTFRNKGEGSGNPTDIDQFDETYDHIIVWYPETQDIIGGYRLNTFDLALKNNDLNAMYTHKQIQYSPDFFESLNQGSLLELGRSFVVPEFQNDPRGVLKELWGGIGQYLVRNKNIRYMLDTVSVSGDYSHLSRTLIKHFYFHLHKDEQNLSSLVNPIYSFNELLPYEDPFVQGVLQEHNTELKFKRLIKSLDDNKKGIPPLISHYPNFMTVKYVSASEDPEFNTTDFLVIGDLTKVNPVKAIKVVGSKELAEQIANR